MWLGLFTFWLNWRQDSIFLKALNDKLEMGTGILNRRHFDFYHEDAPCFKLDILNLNFPPHMVIVLFFCQFELLDWLVLR